MSDNREDKNVPEIDFEFTTDSYTAIPFYNQSSLTDEELIWARDHRAVLNVWRSNLIRGMTASIKAFIAGRNLETKSVCYPATWWDAVKERWFTARMKNRWPVHWTTVTWTAHELEPLRRLPDSRITFTEHKFTKVEKKNANLPD